MGYSHSSLATSAHLVFAAEVHESWRKMGTRHIPALTSFGQVLVGLEIDVDVNFFCGCQRELALGEAKRGYVRYAASNTVFMRAMSLYVIRHVSQAFQRYALTSARDL